ncbi:hypothetical protein L1277_003115 [Okibacterium sp. HSC-33S16]|uniref:pyridoxamine 5'-phosphate oxidase family protein n=1 Tax=Okibacterium sp. HSC-33S16 TaxID=2910965 RepID=UPI0020A16A78|nr:pyridoxamine 5'-phosphate oxidase family protein [Okibacterium sp. HSC-33S16]MCP2033002.1 hypothetical protein [Okibacterium sp. HSC-33S16]
MSVANLTEHESLARLAEAPVGRIVTVVDGIPYIHPVSHSVIQGFIYFRTLPGDKLVGIAVNASVLFEGDGIEGDSAWSVIVRGMARRVDDDPDEFGPVESQLRAPFVGGRREAVVRIVPQSITGRLFTQEAIEEGDVTDPTD